MLFRPNITENYNNTNNDNNMPPPPPMLIKAKEGTRFHPWQAVLRPSANPVPPSCWGGVRQGQVRSQDFNPH